LKLRRAYRVWQRHVAVYAKLYRSSLTLNFVEPVLYLTAMGFGLGAFVRQMEGQTYIEFIAPGIVSYSAMFAAAFECTYGTYIRMTHQKTFDAILATPVNLDDLVAGEVLWGATKSLLYGSIILIVVAAFGLLDSPLVIAALPFLFLGGVIFAEISVIVTALIPRIDYFNYFFTLVLTPMFLFAGVFFPVDTLPPLIARLVWFTPLYHVVNIVRALSHGSFPLGDALWVAAAAAILAPYPFRLMRRRIIP
jgi:lipooligosaccharide transport system permease protein